MNKKVIMAALVASLLGAAPAVIAHHGPGQFLGGDVTVTGSITDIRFVNPHAYVYLDVVNDEGETEAWRFEMQAGSLLRRAGWSSPCWLSSSRSLSIGVAIFQLQLSCG